MKRHNTYDFMTEVLIKDLRRAGMVKAFNKALGITGKDPARRDLRAVAHGLSADPEEFIARTMDGAIMAQEIYWKYYTDRHVMFPADIELLNHIQSAKFDIEGLHLTFPYDCFMFAPPGGFMLGGYECPGVMVSYMSYAERTKVYNALMKELHMPPIELIKDTTGQITDQDEKFLSVEYKSLIGTLDVMHPIHSTSRAMIPISFMKAALTSPDPQTYMQRIGKLASDQRYTFDLEDEEVVFQFALIKLIVGLAVYIQALGDEVLRGGYPHPRGMPYENRMTGGAMRAHQIRHTLSRAQRDKVSEHYRSWHFRTLVHDKWYTGEWEGKPRGSRVVFVRDSWINQKVEPVTVEDK